MLIKICGIKNTKIISICESHKVDFYGLIFFKKSPRNISLNEAKKLTFFSKNLNIEPVGVFVNEKIENISKTITNLEINYIQLHGDEDSQYVNLIKKNFNIKIIKKIAIKNKGDFDKIKNYKNVDYYLFDYKPNINELPGGNSKQFDWSLLDDLKTDKPWFLSGGINAYNINYIKKNINPDGIDLSSGVEDSPGIKNKHMVNKFIKKFNE